MTAQTTLRLNLTGLAEQPEQEAARYRSAIDMAAYADRNGFSVVSVEEHHCAENGWLPAPLLLAGMIVARTERIAVQAAARRAARFGLPFYAAMEMPEIERVYHEELARCGKQGLFAHPGESNAMIFVDEDPETAWEELAPFFLRESREYASWKLEGVPRPSEDDAESVAELRAQGRYQILTPEQCLERIRARGVDFRPCLHPLAGGIPTDRAWRCLELYAERVLGVLRTR